MPSVNKFGIYVNPSSLFAKLTKLQSLNVKPLDKYMNAKLICKTVGDTLTRGEGQPFNKSNQNEKYYNGTEGCSTRNMWWCIFFAFWTLGNAKKRFNLERKNNRDIPNGQLVSDTTNVDKVRSSDRYDSVDWWIVDVHDLGLEPRVILTPQPLHHSFVGYQPHECD